MVYSLIVPKYNCSTGYNENPDFYHVKMYTKLVKRAFYHQCYSNLSITSTCAVIYFNLACNWTSFPGRKEVFAVTFSICTLVGYCRLEGRKLTGSWDNWSSSLLCLSLSCVWFLSNLIWQGSQVTVSKTRIPQHIAILWFLFFVPQIESMFTKRQNLKTEKKNSLNAYI